MALRTPQEYLESLRDDRVVYFEGERVRDVTKHPLLRRAANGMALDFAVAQMPEFRDTFVTKDESGEEVSFVFMPPRSADDLLQRRQIIQTLSRIGYGFPGGAKFMGIDCLNSCAINARRIDEALGTNYGGRVDEYRKFLLKSDPAMSGCMTDAKGDRSLRPSKQVPHQDYYLRIVDETKDGIVVRGAKYHITGAPMAKEMIVMPCRAHREADKDYAVVFAIPVDTKGIIMVNGVETYAEEGNFFDYPISASTYTGSGLVVFDDVFVPMERVFLKGEWQFSADFTYMFANFHRLSADSYKYAELEILVGCAALLAEYNGLEAVPHVRDKLAWLMMYAEGVEALGRASCLDCVEEPGSHLVYPNPMYSNIAKFQFADNFHHAVKLVQDIAGGMGADVLSSKDWLNPETRPYLERYLGGKAGIPTEHRLRAFHLCKDLTSSFHTCTTIHAEGSLAAQTLSVLNLGDWDRFKAAAKRAARIDDGTEHPVFSRLPEYPGTYE